MVIPYTSLHSTAVRDNSMTRQWPVSFASSRRRSILSNHRNSRGEFNHPSPIYVSSEFGFEASPSTPSTLYSPRPSSKTPTWLFLSETSDYHATTMSPVSVDDVLSTQDIIVGTILAFILAFGYSYLNGQSSSTSFVSWGNQVVKDEHENNVEMQNGTESEEGIMSKMDDRIFNENDWKEISREENYILYNTRIRKKISSRKRKNEDVGNEEVAASQPDKNDRKSGVENSTSNKENKVVVLALMALFLPIFTVEIFFALSRQILCEMGGGMDHGGLAQKLCSPLDNFVR